MKPKENDDWKSLKKLVYGIWIVIAALVVVFCWNEHKIGMDSAYDKGYEAGIEASAAQALADSSDNPENDEDDYYYPDLYEDEDGTIRDENGDVVNSIYDDYEDEIDEIPDTPPKQEQASAPAQTAPAPSPSTSNTDTQSITVYITRTGECYHRGSCYHLRQSKIATTLSQAKSIGYRACSHCSPPQ